MTILKAANGHILRAANGHILRWDAASYTVINYGLLYNWFTITDARNITASGWAIQTSSEFDSMVTYLGGNTVSGAKLKETGFASWTTPNTGATNEVGYNGRGSGVRSYGMFSNLQTSLYLHSNNDYANYNSYGLTCNFNAGSSGKLVVDNSYQWKRFGMSARAFRAATTEELLLPDGPIAATYTGNDLKVYRCCKIGSIVTIADNLAETKYRNGDTIPEVTDNIAWSALSTGALCAYNNNWANV